MAEMGRPTRRVERPVAVAERHPRRVEGLARNVMAVFIDTFVNKIDRKGRVSVPATFRAALATQPFQGIVTFPSFNLSALQCAGMDWMQSLIDGTARVDLFSPEHDDLTASL